MNKIQAHGNAKLNLKEVAAIRDLQGFLSAAAVARQFAIGKQTVLDIWHGKTWRRMA